MFSIWITACGQQVQEIPAYYQEVVEHNGIGDIFDRSGFTFVRENGVSSFTEYVRADPDRYFQEVLILVHDDTNMNAVFIHKEPIDSIVANIEDLEANFEDFQTRVTQNFGALRPLRPDDWRNAWIHEISNEDEQGLPQFQYSYIKTMSIIFLLSFI